MGGFYYSLFLNFLIISQINQLGHKQNCLNIIQAGL